jgi:hypothetical protein
MKFFSFATQSEKNGDYGRNNVFKKVKDRKCRIRK